MSRNGMSASLYGSSRQNFRYKCAVRWIEENRPDVWEKILELCDKKYPPRATKAPRMQLPKELNEAMSTASKVALDKQKHPERYCPVSRCLWKTTHLTPVGGERIQNWDCPGGYCPRHQHLRPKESQ